MLSAAVYTPSASALPSNEAAAVWIVTPSPSDKVAPLANVTAPTRNPPPLPASTANRPSAATSSAPSIENVAPSARRTAPLVTVSVPSVVEVALENTNE